MIKHLPTILLLLFTAGNLHAQVKQINPGRIIRSLRTKTVLRANKKLKNTHSAISGALLNLSGSMKIFPLIKMKQNNC